MDNNNRNSNDTSPTNNGISSVEVNLETASIPINSDDVNTAPTCESTSTSTAQVNAETQIAGPEDDDTNCQTTTEELMTGFSVIASGPTADTLDCSTTSSDNEVVVNNDGNDKDIDDDTAADVGSPNTTATNAIEITNDLERRTKEIGLFSAMAYSEGGGGGFDTASYGEDDNTRTQAIATSDDIDDDDDTDDDDIARRKKEMTVFSTLATDGSNTTPPKKDTSDKNNFHSSSPNDATTKAAEMANDLERRKKEMGMFAMMANSTTVGEFDTTSPDREATTTTTTSDDDDNDAARRKKEMSSFAAFAAGGCNTTTSFPTTNHSPGSRGNTNSNSPNNAVKAVEIANDLERRKKEMGLFSAMANPGGGGFGSPDSSMDRHASNGSSSSPDGSTRKTTTNNDDALATVESNISPTAKGISGRSNTSSSNDAVKSAEMANDLVRRKKEMGLFSAMANPGGGGFSSPDSSTDIHTSSSSGSIPDGSTRKTTTNDDDAARRKKEMSSFAAFATGGSNISPTTKGISGRSNTSSSNDAVKSAEMANDLERRKREMGLFSAMANPGGGGFSSPDSSTDRHTSSGSGNSPDGSTRKTTTNDDDAAQRKKGMNAFSASATVESNISPTTKGTSGKSKTSSPNDTTKSAEMANDLERRKREMGLFSAMANSGDNSSSPNDTTNAAEMAKDLIRRKKEMGLFSAMANSGGGSGSPDDSMDRNTFNNSGKAITKIAAVEPKISLTTTTRSSAHSSSNPSSPTDSAKAAEEAEYAERRKNEIGLFSAMAAGSGNASSSESQSSPSSSFAGNTKSSTFPDGSGTFVSNKKEGTTSSTSKNNLEAALASLSDPTTASSSTNPTNNHGSPAPIIGHPRPVVPRRKPVHNQMYSECVVLPRPLFFGRALPTRVVEEAQRLSSFRCRLGAMLEGGNGLDSRRGGRSNQPWECSSDGSYIGGVASPPSTPLEDNDDSCFGGDDGGGLLVVPDGYKSFEGALMAYGHGFARRSRLASLDGLQHNGIDSNSYHNSLQPLDDDHDDNDSSMNSNNKDDCVKLYVPLWGDLNRLEREDRIHSKNATGSIDYSKDEGNGNDDNDCSSRLESSCEHVSIDKDVESTSTNSATSPIKSPCHDENQKLPAANTANVGKPTGDENDTKTITSQSALHDPQHNQSSSSSPNDPPLMSGNLFLQYARGDIGNYGDSLTSSFTNSINFKSNSINSNNNNTLISVPETTALSPTSNLFPPNNATNNHQTSNSFEGSELTKQVGLNDNLSRALDSLTENDDILVSGTSCSIAVDAAEKAAAAMAAVTDKDGRPLTNLELMGGKVPVYGCDDAPLPSGADMGNFETKDEQLKSGRLSEWQDTIALRAVPNVFGPVVCPNTYDGPDDSHSWFARAGEVVRTSRGRGGDTGLGGGGSNKNSNRWTVPKTIRSIPETMAIPTCTGGKELPVGMGWDTKSSGQSYNSSSSVDSGGGTRSIEIAHQTQAILPPPPPIPPFDTLKSFEQQQVEQLDNYSTHSRRSRGTSPQASSTGRGNVHQQQQHQHHSNNKLKKEDDRRMGWWNISDDIGSKPPVPPSDGASSEHQYQHQQQQQAAATATTTSCELNHPPIQLSPPYDEVSHSRDVRTHLAPTAKQLRKQNRSLSDLHPASPTAKFLPFLSDRPPSTRYLQIDTRVVGFPAVGEIEPFFCSLAIWHVEPTTNTTGSSTSTTTRGNSNTNHHPSGNTDTNGMTPNFGRCGRITESLRFDMISEAEVANKCRGALWPNRKTEDCSSPSNSTTSPPSVTTDYHHQQKQQHEKKQQQQQQQQHKIEDSLQGSRCGVFPLPSNFQICDLYAVLIVHKTLAEDSELDIYHKQPKTTKNSHSHRRSHSHSNHDNDNESTSSSHHHHDNNSNSNNNNNNNNNNKSATKELTELSRHRTRAGNYADRLGQFIMPFAFGVAPLAKIIRLESPSITASHMVQIPLFKLAAGKGERQIVDHILAAGNCPGNFKHADVTIDGKAVLVMRNFGYLGLHSAIHSNSKLVVDRVVDFTGDLQVRRRHPDEIDAYPDDHQNDNTTNGDNDGIDGRAYVAPSWHTDFIGEPTVNGGRNYVATDTDDDHHHANNNNKNGYSNSALYTQELAPLPLSITQPATRQPRIPGGSISSNTHNNNDLSSHTGTNTNTNTNTTNSSSRGDAESFFYTSLTNELLCHPRILHQLGCVKRNISIKIEIRRLTFDERLHSYVATLPRSGPSLHNTRRGAFLVNELYTACAYHCLDPHFMDEFKIKLPLIYSGSSDGDGKLVALFSAYNVRVKERKRSRFFRRNHHHQHQHLPHHHHDIPSASEDGSDDTTSEQQRKPIELLGCGYLPLFMDGDVPCLLSNGLHDVKLKYMPKPMVEPMMDNTTTINNNNNSNNTITSEYDPDTLILEPLSSSQDTATTPHISSPSQSDAFGTNFGANFATKFWSGSDSASVSVEDCLNAVVVAPKQYTHHHNNTNINNKSQHTSSEDDTSTSDTFSHHFRTTASPSPVSSIADSISSKWSTGRDTREQQRFGTIQSHRSRKGTEPMVLQVRTIALSSVHPQNMALAQFFSSTPTVPRPIPIDDLILWNKWITSTDRLGDYSQHATTSTTTTTTTTTQSNLTTTTTITTHEHDQKQLLQSQHHSTLDESLLRHTIDIATPSSCPPFELVPHFVRIMFQLWRSLVCGNGDPSILWANPASLIPLRLHSFSTLLYVLNSVNSSMMKSGVMQLDGKGKWNITATSRVVMMLFDEDEIFMDAYSESLEDLLAKQQKHDDDDNDDDDDDGIFVSSSSNDDTGQEACDDDVDTDDGSSFVDGGEVHVGVGAGVDVGDSDSDSDSTPSPSIDNITPLSSTATKPPPIQCDSSYTCLPPNTTDCLRSDSPTIFSSINSKDDLNLLDFADKPTPLRSRSYSAPDPQSPHLKIDSKTDFQSALNAGEILNSPTGVGGKTTFGSGSGSGGFPAANRRRWMTVPSSALATIEEDNDTLLDVGGSGQEMKVKESRCLSDGGLKEKGRDGDVPLSTHGGVDPGVGAGVIGGDTLDTELVLTRNKSIKPSKVKQMRVPKVLSSTKQTMEVIKTIGGDNETKDSNNDQQKNTGSAAERSKVTNKTVPKTDKEIETAGTAFLDKIGKNFDYSVVDKVDGEDKRVGFSHHRKTRSRCSIDWTLPPTDLLIENHQQMEHLQLHDASPPSNINDTIVGDDDGGAVESALTPLEKESHHGIDGNKGCCKATEGGDVSRSGVQTKTKQHPFKTTKKRIKKDSDHEKIMLPNYANRIISLGKRHNKQGRWFPYTYEVVIFQWVIFLSEQARKMEKGRNSRNSSESLGGRPQGFVSSARTVPTAKSLSDAAYKVRGLSIGCAPVLFEIIKKSLGFRIDSLFRKQRKNTSDAEYNTFVAPPLVSLDSSIVTALEELISMVTDACIDTRNFDSWNFRKSAIVVNDAIVRFLRDLFAFLDTRVVHRLVLVYFSRFGMRKGKHWQDRDSEIGLRCSLEITKLKLNAITLLVRFADFVKVNCPIMEHWGNWPWSVPTRSSRHFFTNAMSELENLSMGGFTASEERTSLNGMQIPAWKPHWLIELVTDICLSSTGHVEPAIQQRSASLLFELFWSSSREGKVNGTLTVVASMYVPFILKILGHAPFLSSLPPKSQLSKDLLPCMIFIIQSAPSGLLRALWRKLCKQTEGKASQGTFGGIGQLNFTSHHIAPLNDPAEECEDNHHMPCILDVFSLLNLALKTFEYEGSEANLEEETRDNLHERIFAWEREFFPAVEEQNEVTEDSNQSHGMYHMSLEYLQNNSQMQHDKDDSPKYTTASSRKWHAHDGAIVIINASRNIVREYLWMLRPLEDDVSLPIPSDRATSGVVPTGNTVYEKGHSSGSNEVSKHQVSDEQLRFSIEDKVIFARAIASVYLHCLSLRQSDIVYIKTLIASVEIVKVFDIEVFLAAVGETLQHWMRVILVHCGARRAKVRIEALEFLALILRLTWGCFGSFYRVRVPLIAVQTEVMERIVATAAARYYREQRRLKLPVQFLTNEGAEAALTPFWRTLDRLHHRSASNNAAFKSALDRLAESMKTLYRAYIAAHALAIVNRTNTQSALHSPNNRPVAQVSRVVSASGGFSKKILGSQGSHLLGNVVTHSEAVEEAFLAAADAFQPTELPLHRVAWLRKLAEFHSSRSRFAEEGTCRFLIHKTLRQAAHLHENLWSSIPFWPWANDSSDGVHLNGEGPVGSTSEYFDGDTDLEELTATDYDSNDKNQTFRRIFYRVANSVRMRTGDWDIGGNKHLFYGVTLPSEYNDISPWISFRELEEDMVEEAEAAGELFLKAGIIESSRYAWSLSTQFYSSVYNYAKLAYVYRKLALVVESHVPVVDTSTQLELSSPLGRFYRVYYHGGAADELKGKEFVYRAAVNIKLETFCDYLVEVIRSILPEKTPIEIVKDDGRIVEQQKRDQKRMGAPREAINIRVTPLRPLLDRNNCARGTSEWFYKQAQISDHSSSNESRYQCRSNDTHNAFSRGNYQTNGRTIGCGELIGVHKFSFTQPKDRFCGCRDLLKAPNGDVSEKSLKVTELLVGQSFPTSVTRQTVVQRAIFHQTPLEAGVEEVCSWCAVLFRTAVATNGLAVIGNQGEEGIGKAATKVVVDCIHSSRIKEIGQTMLKKVTATSDNLRVEDRPERLSDDKRNEIQCQLARAIVILLELLHVLIGRNRDLLLAIVKAKKRRDGSSTSSHMEFPTSPSHLSNYDGTNNFRDGVYSGKGHDDFAASAVGSYASNTILSGDNTITLALQRELQFGFISMTNDLKILIQKTIHSETPRWMRLCCQDKNYFPSGAYRQTRIAMSEELLYFDCASQAYHEHNVDNDTGKAESISVPEILRMNRNSPHESCTESSPSRVSRNSELPQIIHHQDSASQSSYTFK